MRALDPARQLGVASPSTARLVGEIGAGLVVLLGVGRGDGEAQAAKLADKVARLRVFDDDDGRMDRSLIDLGGAALCVSQFTLYGDTRRGLRPSFTEAAEPADGERLYEHSATSCRRARCRWRRAFSALA